MEIIRASRWTGDHSRQRAFPLPRGALPTFLLGHGDRRHSRGQLQLYHEVRHRYQKGSLRQHGPFRWHHHVPRYRRSYAEGDHRLGSFHHEDQDHRPSREEILRLDRRLHLGFPLYLPGDVDLQARVRRGWPRHRSPQMLLNTFSILLEIFLVAFYYYHSFISLKIHLLKPSSRPNFD